MIYFSFSDNIRALLAFIIFGFFVAILYYALYDFISFFANVFKIPKNSLYKFMKTAKSKLLQAKSLMKALTRMSFVPLTAR